MERHHDVHGTPPGLCSGKRQVRFEWGIWQELPEDNVVVRILAEIRIEFVEPNYFVLGRIGLYDPPHCQAEVDKLIHRGNGATPGNLPPHVYPFRPGLELGAIPAIRFFHKPFKVRIVQPRRQGPNRLLLFVCKLQEVCHRRDIPALGSHPGNLATRMSGKNMPQLPNVLPLQAPMMESGRNEAVGTPFPNPDGLAGAMGIPRSHTSSCR